MEKRSLAAHIWGDRKENIGLLNDGGKGENVKRGNSSTRPSQLGRVIENQEMRKRGSCRLATLLRGGCT